MTAREKLINELKQINHKGYLSGIGELQAIADFILEDRKRIVKPLIKIAVLNSDNTPIVSFRNPKINLLNACDEVLRLSGVKL